MLLEAAPALTIRFKPELTGLSNNEMDEVGHGPNELPQLSPMFYFPRLKCVCCRYRESQVAVKQVIDIVDNAVVSTLILAISSKTHRLISCHHPSIHPRSIRPESASTTQIESTTSSALKVGCRSEVDVLLSECKRSSRRR